MTTVPTVTITVGGVPVGAAAPAAPAEDAALHLHMTYVQAVRGDQRYQYVVFPPAIEALGAPKVGEPTLLFLRRKQEFKNNRSKWFHNRFSKRQNTTLPNELKNLEEQGWLIGGVVVVPLEVDDYLEAWRGETPHKALRAINRALEAAHGLTVK